MRKVLPAPITIKSCDDDDDDNDDEEHSFIII